MSQLIDTAPAQAWTEALPLGNGGLGAMVHGGADRERLDLNDATAWSGSPRSEQREPRVSAKESAAAIERAIGRLAEGDHAGAEGALTVLQHLYTQSFVPLGSLLIEAELTDGASASPVSGYVRRLDLRTGVHESQWRMAAGRWVRTRTWAPQGTRAIVHELESEVPLDLRVSLVSDHPALAVPGEASDGGASEAAGAGSAPGRAATGAAGDRNSAAASASTTDTAATVVGLRLPSDVVPPFGVPQSKTEPGIEYDDDPAASVTALLALAVAHDGQLEVPATSASAPAGAADTESRAASAPRLGELRVSGATRVRVVVASRTTYVPGTASALPSISADPSAASEQALAEALRLATDQDCLATHVGAFAPLMDRVSLELATAPAQADAPPALAGTTPDAVGTRDRVLAAARTGRPAVADPGLVPLLLDYGRYLLLSSSLGSCLPANLQGLWNHRARPFWCSGYTTNINLEMNYWGADVAALPETVEPLLALTETIAVSGRETAARLYGARGWTCHHNTDAWGFSQQPGAGEAPGQWSFWPLGGAWLAVQLHDHLSFGSRWCEDPAERRRLEERVLRLSSGAVRFLLDWMRVDSSDGPLHGTLGTPLSTSPENTFLTTGGEEQSVSRSSAMDLALARALLDAHVGLARRLGEDVVTAEEAEAALQRLGRPVITDDGRLQEWGEPLEAADPQHRHQSQLWDVYPGASTDAALARAAARILDEKGDETTGWSLVWRIALRARLRDAAAVERLVEQVLRPITEADEAVLSEAGGVYPNMFTAHPPFQIDANLGLVGALAECLVQSHAGSIDLLPAWPASLGAGRVRGLVARPGVGVDMEWRADGATARPVRVALRALGPEAVGEHLLRWAGGSRVVALMEDTPVVIEI